MTIENAKELFFRDLNKRVNQTKSAKTHAEVMKILRPDDLVLCIAQGANALSNNLGIKSNTKTEAAITYTINRAQNYSKNTVMPLWKELNSLLSTADTMSNIGQGLDWVGIIPFGDILGKILGLKFKGGLRRGDYLVENLDKSTLSLIDVAKYDFDHHIRPAILAEFGR